MKAIRIILFTFGLTIIGIEGLLRLDPLGMIYYPEVLMTTGSPGRFTTAGR
ncbi:MAG: hypothetical protein U0521_23270 [Anaerolineae bacterium]